MSKRVRIAAPNDNVEGTVYTVLYSFIKTYVQYNMTLILCYRYKAHKKAIEKILRNNTQIISKLDTLIAGQKDIESRLSNLEKKLDQNNNDMIDSDGIKVIEMYIIN